MDITATMHRLLEAAEDEGRRSIKWTMSVADWMRGCDERGDVRSPEGGVVEAMPLEYGDVAVEFGDNFRNGSVGLVTDPPE